MENPCFRLRSKPVGSRRLASSLRRILRLRAVARSVAGTRPNANSTTRRSRNGARISSDAIILARSTLTSKSSGKYVRKSTRALAAAALPSASASKLHLIALRASATSCGQPMTCQEQPCIRRRTGDLHVRYSRRRFRRAPSPGCVPACQSDGVLLRGPPLVSTALD